MIVEMGEQMVDEGSEGRAPDVERGGFVIAGEPATFERVQEYVEDLFAQLVELRASAPPSVGDPFDVSADAAVWHPGVCVERIPASNGEVRQLHCVKVKDHLSPWHVAVGGGRVVAVWSRRPFR